MKMYRHALRGHAAFGRVFAAGRRLEGTLLRCIVVLEPAPNPQMNVGYAVSSRVYTAVWRNRLRRLMREGFALQQESLAEALQRRGMSASIVFAFKPHPQSFIRRLKLQPVGEEIADLCTQLRGIL